MLAFRNDPQPRSVCDGQAIDSQVPASLLTATFGTG